MPKLTLIVEGRNHSEWPVQGKDVLIGRGSNCEVRLNDPSVSRHHAKVAKIDTGYFIKDLQSTNGVTLNGHRVRKHMLKDGDSVQIGNNELRFVADTGEGAAVPEEAVTLSPKATHRRRKAAPPPSEHSGHAYVRLLSGSDRGSSKLVNRSLFTIGKPGGNLAVISRRAEGHFLLHLGGDTITRNDEPVHGAGIKLNSGDVIQVGDIRLEFYYEP